MPPLDSPRSPLRGLGDLIRDSACASKLARKRSPAKRSRARGPASRTVKARVACTQREIDRQARGGSISVLASGELCEGRRGPNGSGKGNRRRIESSAPRGSVKSRRPEAPILAPPACTRRRSLALQSLTAVLRRAVARPFQPRATACIGPTEGEVTASPRGATAGFCGQMHGRLDARLSRRSGSRTFGPDQPASRQVVPPLRFTDVRARPARFAVCLVGPEVRNLLGLWLLGWPQAICSASSSPSSTKNATASARSSRASATKA